MLIILKLWYFGKNYLQKIEVFGFLVCVIMKLIRDSQITNP